MIDDKWLAEACKETLACFNSRPTGEHTTLLKAYFEGADVVFGVMPTGPRGKLERFLLKGRKRLAKISRTRVAEPLAIAVIPVTCAEEAKAMSDVLGDRSF